MWQLFKISLSEWSMKLFIVPDDDWKFFVNEFKNYRNYKYHPDCKIPLTVGFLINKTVVFIVLSGVRLFHYSYILSDF